MKWDNLREWLSKNKGWISENSGWLKLIVVAIIIFSLMIGTGGCSGFTNWCSKTFKGVSKSDYVVVVYGGPQPVRYWIIRKGFVNSESGSDGSNWTSSNLLKRTAGTTIIEEIKGRTDEEVIADFRLEDVPRGK
jgi:hypothetical protein